MPSKLPVRAARGLRIRNFECAAVALIVTSTTLVWLGTSAPILAKSPQVPFRFMEATVLETQAALAAGTITSEDLVRMYLARIDAFDKTGPAINAMIRLNAHALTEARALDAERRAKGARGPLHGIPILLKDNYDTFDMPTSAASLSLATSIPPDDGYLVRRLREAGAIFLGKTNMHEFAFGITTISSLGGQTLNPYDLRRNPGGSSGGTGAGVTANFAVIGMGSDTCGSIRIPSSHNSLVGLRVTQGLFSRDGIIPLALTQDVGGPLARTVEDIAVILDETAGVDPNDPATQVAAFHTPASYTNFLRTGRLRGARFGLMTDVLVTTPADQEVADVILRAKQELQSLGATVIDVVIPDFANVSNTSVITMEFKENLDAYLAATPAAPFKTLQEIFNSGLFHPSLTTVLTNALASGTNTQAYRDRLAGRVIFRQALVRAMDDDHLDGLIYPTIRQKPIFVPATNQPGSNCRVSAQSGLPAISVPVGFTTDGIPVGMEFLGREFVEGDLLEIAFSWEQATHHRRLPATTPEIEPHWPIRVTDGVATFVVNADLQRFRFTAPGFETFVYLDPGMNVSKQWISGELKDSRWHIHYKVPVDSSKSKLASIFVDNLWAGGGTYNLFGAPISQ
ncbi:MAG TPA: amidase family protein [Vicinamibacterales bacterium]|nr:amidase family protein [Vicinamibacterales bacterium]